MKKNYHFDAKNISSPFTGTYKKLDDNKHLNVQDIKTEDCYNLDFDLNKKSSKQTDKLDSFIKIITQFFSLKKNLYTNGNKVCTDEFKFINPSKI